MFDRKPEIFIVGAGPVGLTIACGLLKNNISCRIIDKRENSSSIPRAVGISHATLNAFKQLGIADRILEKAMKVSEIIIYWKDKRLTRINYRNLDLLVPFFLHFPQSMLEKLLLEQFNFLGGEVNRGVELISVKSNGLYSSVKLQNLTGKIENAQYPYLVACDGGHSFVRDELNIEYHERDYNKYFILADVKLQWDHPANITYYFLMEIGYVMIVPITEGHHRVIISFNEPYPVLQPDLSAEAFEHHLQNRLNMSIKIEKIIWSTTAPFRHRLSSQAQKDNIYFAGDALHQFSPVGGPTLNAGINDAITLIWRLTYLIQRKMHLQGMKSYNDERKYHMSQLLSLTEKATECICFDSKRDKEFSNRFLPRFENRNFLKHELPKFFSGIAQQIAPQNDLNATLFVNRYAPLLDHIYHYLSVEGISNLTAKFILFAIVKKNAFQLMQFIENLYRLYQDFFIYFISDHNCTLIGKNIKPPVIINRCAIFDLYYNNRQENIFLIRPDGFIAAIVSADEVGENSLKNYFKEQLIIEE